MSAVPVQSSPLTAYVKSQSTGNAVEPTVAGSVQTAVEGLLEKLVLKALSRLTFGTGGELRVVISALPGTNTIGNVQANIGGFTGTQSQQLVAQQNYQTSFRRNIVVS